MNGLGGLPNFRDNKDRAVYLLAEYKVPLSAVVIAAGVWLAYLRPELPTPPEEVRWIATSWGVLAFPSWWFGTWFVHWLHSPDKVMVGVANGGEEDEYTAYEIPPDTWKEAEMKGEGPYRPESGFDFIVTNMTYYEDIEQLEVEGVPRAGMEPWEQWQTQEKIDEYYNEHMGLRRQYARLKSMMRSKATEIHDLTIMKMLESLENAELATDVTITEMIEDMENQADELPDEPTEDWDREPEDKSLDPVEEIDSSEPDPLTADGGNYEQ